jgi:integrase
MARKRAPRGRGTVYQRKDGLWVGEVSAGSQGGKRRRYRVHGKTPADVDRKMAAVRTRMLRGELASAWDVGTVSELLNRWLAAAAQRVRATTTSDYATTVETHLRPAIGDVPLSSLTAKRIERLYADMRTANTGARTIQKAHVVLGAALRYAVKHELLGVSPLAKIDAPRYKRGAMRPYDAEEARTFLAAVKGHKYEPVFLLAIYGGLRQGEILGLQRSDVDLANGCVNVQRTLQSLAGDRGLVETKSAAGRRRVDLPAIVMNALRAQLKTLAAAGNDSTYLFPGRDWKGLDRRAFSRWQFETIFEAHPKLRKVTFHSLRHACASIMLAAGDNPKVVQEKLGHSRISVTLDLYSHVIPSLQRDSADRMGELLAPPDRPHPEKRTGRPLSVKRRPG